MLAVENITKRFPGVIALNNVTMEFPAGKVTAVVGENGAGKSTLMKILSGVYADYEGRIVYKGQSIAFATVKDAQKGGIAIIHQELNLMPFLTVEENVFLGCEIVNGIGLLDKKAMREKTIELLGRLKLEISPAVLVADLKVGQQQLVEIAKALLNDAEVIIMDEPTSAISEREIEVLFDIINDLKNQNRTIIYISHKLDELFRIADRFIVMRDGSVIESGDLAGMSHDALIQKMVGRHVNTLRKLVARSSEQEELLQVDNLCLKHSTRRNENILNNISFRLRKGEIVGLFGLMGAGRTELMESIFGLHPTRCSGTMNIDGSQRVLASAAEAIRAGIAFVPEDRKKDGLVLGLDVRSNICLASLDEMENGLRISEARESSMARKYVDDLKVKTPSIKSEVRNLSGGNQQKVVIGKWLARKPKILLLDEPTRGVDIGAKHEIYKLILDLAKTGMGIIMVSSELPEILAVSDRVLVMCEGSLTAEIPIEEATESNLLKAAIPTNKS